MNSFGEDLRGAEYGSEETKTIDRGIQSGPQRGEPLIVSSRLAA